MSAAFSSTPLQIITADERMRERRGIKGVLTGISGIGKTSQLWTLNPDTTLFINLEAGELAVQGWPGDEIRIRDWRLLSRLALRGDVGLGEGWVAGDWHSETLEGTLSLALRNLGLRAGWGEPGRLQAMRMRLVDRLMRPNSLRRGCRCCRWRC